MLKMGGWMVIPSTLWLALDYFTYFFSYGIFLPFWSIWLKGEGVDPAMIGLLLGVGLTARFVGSLILTPAVKDPSKLITALRLFAFLSLLFTVAFMLGTHWAWLFLVMTGFNVFFAPMVPLGDSLAGTWQKQFPLDYGKIRVWGSIAFIISSSLLGILIDAFGHPIILYGLIASTLALFLTSMLRPKIMPQGKVKKTEHHHVSFMKLISDGPVWRFLLCVSLLQGAHAAYYGFSALYWEKAGYDTATIGYLWSLGVVAEVVVFMFSRRLFRRWSARNLLLLSAFAGLLRWGMMGSFTALPALIIVQILHSGTFTVCHLAAMRFITARQEHEIIRLQAVYSALAMGGSIAIMTIVSGWLYEKLPNQEYLIFWLMAVLTIPAMFIRPKVQPQNT
ncbi:3-phenylpropionate MFS transporter [Proteus mirabilis]|uniref:3-phenylpropionate MFS transporter n=2 Tax=Proteus mirabilis TaxID=584 RepID=UPI0018C82BC1|nr:3-phenylpropionate MFS transporter [Proteus mirabilis]MBG3006100.1 3-phenylpropionate MFS transporter [Proteus mirabilis]MBG3083038.1 3-phenylpropionate MFS transporter [Proteus mirabilis]MBG3086142.1 3-phenylpropionate MFS transporter [Proteus mirabilis]MBG5946549.1 3-phenylpropionate MFS transporter [Proteus mirabilis]